MLSKWILIITALVVIGSITGIIWSLKRSRAHVTEEFGPDAGTHGVIYFFRANWCGHCNKFKPVWDEFVNQCNSSDELSELTLVELDVDEETSKPIMEKYAVRGFPTVVFESADKQKSSKFQQDRTLENLLSFARQNM